MMKVLMAQKGKHPVSVFTLCGGCGLDEPEEQREVQGRSDLSHHAVRVDSWFDRMKLKAGLSDIRIHDIRRTAGGRVNRASGLVGCVEASRPFGGRADRKALCPPYDRSTA
jgi:hypothetical protein